MTAREKEGIPLLQREERVPEKVFVFPLFLLIPLFRAATLIILVFFFALSESATLVDVNIFIRSFSNIDDVKMVSSEND